MHQWFFILTLSLFLAACASQQQSPRKSLLSEQTESLNGTRWSLVQIQSMDDSQYQPQQAEQYTLEFAPMGSFSGRADCNSIQGNWVHGGKNQITINPVVSTRALCPPESLYDRFLSDLGFTRSFVIRDEHLFLATMADGAILEFAPMQGGEPAPAFNCSEAEGSIESMICEASDLMQLDLYLDELFQAGLANFPEADIPTYRTLQRGWISGRNDCWKEEDIKQCVIEEYHRRISELEVKTGYLTVPKPTQWQCEDELLTVYFYNAAVMPVAVINRDTSQHFAWLVRAASGARYQGGNLEFWTRNNAATLTLFEKSKFCVLQQ